MKFIAFDTIEGSTQVIDIHQINGIGFEPSKASDGRDIYITMWTFRNSDRLHVATLLVGQFERVLMQFQMIDCNG